jgi:hypothetical protein
MYGKTLSSETTSLVNKQSTSGCIKRPQINQRQSIIIIAGMAMLVTLISIIAAASKGAFAGHDDPLPQPSPSALPTVTPSPSPSLGCILYTEKSVFTRASHYVPIMDKEKHPELSNCLLATSGNVTFSVIRSTVAGIIQACGDFNFATSPTSTICSSSFVGNTLAFANVELRGMGHADLNVTAPLMDGRMISGSMHVGTDFVKDSLTAVAKAVASASPTPTL